MGCMVDGECDVVCYCDGVCELDLMNGMMCDENLDCVLGYCSGGVCCDGLMGICCTNDAVCNLLDVMVVCLDVMMC